MISSLSIRWYIPLALAICAYLLQKRPLNVQAARVYWIVYGLGFLGAVLSLLRAPFLDSALYNTVGMGISFVPFLLFLPVLATRLTRRILLAILVGAAFLWTLEIQRLVKVYGTLYYSTFAETGENKNDIGYNLSLAAVALFYLAVFWRPSRVLRKWQEYAIRLCFGLGGFYIFYNISLIYARGALLATLVGFVLVIVVIFIKSPKKSSGMLWSGLVLAIVVLFVVIFLPKVLATSPQWQGMYDRVLATGVDAFGNRPMLIEKGLFLIGENPFLGVGVGGSIEAISSIYGNYPHYLIHNTFLADWAEKGVLGFLSDVVWLLFYLKILRQKFLKSPLIDQIWLVLFIPLFIQISLKNTGTGAMLALLAGIFYEQYFIEKTKKVSSIQEYRR